MGRGEARFLAVECRARADVEVSALCILAPGLCLNKRHRHTRRRHVRDEQWACIKKDAA
jgi:hypothetical protein